MVFTICASFKFAIQTPYSKLRAEKAVVAMAFGLLVYYLIIDAIKYTFHTNSNYAKIFMVTSTNLNNYVLLSAYLLPFHSH